MQYAQRMWRGGLGIAAAGLLSLGGAGSAGAQPSSAPTASPDSAIESVSSSDRIHGERRGYTLGASIGRGRLAVSCDVCDNVEPLTEALSLSLHGGVMLNPRLALIGEYWTVRYNGRGSDFFPDSQDHYVAQHMVTAGVQLWLIEQVYLRGGVGIGWHVSDAFYANRGRANIDSSLPRPAAAGGAVMDTRAGRYTPAATVGIGFEFAHTRDFAADVQLRVGSTRRPDDEYQVNNVGLTFGASWY